MGSDARSYDDRRTSVRTASPSRLCRSLARSACAVMLILAAPEPSRADVAWADSPVFTVDTRANGSIGWGDSPVFTVDTRHAPSAGFGDSAPISLDITQVARGYADSNLFGFNQPDPTITQVAFPPTVTLGASFWIDVTVENLGDDFVGHGMISISIPGYDEIDDGAWDGDDDPGVWYPTGSSIWHNNYTPTDLGDDYQITSEYVLIEGDDLEWDGQDGIFAEHHTLSVRITAPCEPGEIEFYVRTAFADSDWTVVAYNPTTSSYEDQQGWPVLRYVVNVVDEKLLPSTALETNVQPAIVYRGDPITVTTTIWPENFSETIDDLRITTFADPYQTLEVDQTDHQPVPGPPGPHMLGFSVDTDGVDIPAGETGAPLYVLVESRTGFVGWDPMAQYRAFVRDEAVRPDPGDPYVYDEFAEAAFVRFAAASQIELEMDGLVNFDPEVINWDAFALFLQGTTDRLQAIHSVAELLPTQGNVLEQTINLIRGVIEKRENIATLFDLDSLLDALDDFVGAGAYDEFAADDIDDYVVPVWEELFGMAETKLTGLFVLEEQQWLLLHEAALAGETLDFAPVLATLDAELALMDGAAAHLDDLRDAQPSPYAGLLLPEDTFEQYLKFINDGMSYFPEGGSADGYLNQLSMRLRAIVNEDSVATILQSIDGDPPGPPIDPSITPGDWTGGPSFTVTWTDPDDLTGIGAAYAKFEDPPTANDDWDQQFDDPNGSVVVDLSGISPPVGPTAIYFWLEDGAGNGDYQSYATVDALYDPSSPAPPFDTAWDEGFSTNVPVITANWVDFAEISGIVDYHVQVDVDSTDFASGMIFDAWLGTTDSELLLDEADGVDFDHTYYFRVRAENGAGLVGEFSTVSPGIDVVRLPGDADGDGDVDLDDYASFQACFTGPLDTQDPLPAGCEFFDADDDNDVDLHDFAGFQLIFASGGDG